MLQIDEILPLYPDDASKQLMLTQALEYVRADLTALDHAISCSDHGLALQQVHRAKGTASFLGGNQPGLEFFDDLTNVLKLIQQRSKAKSKSCSVKSNASPSKAEQRNTLSQDRETIDSALKPVEQVLRAIESSLLQSLTRYQPK